jgi:hypothetical protein
VGFEQSAGYAKTEVLCLNASLELNSVATIPQPHEHRGSHLKKGHLHTVAYNVGLTAEPPTNIFWGKTHNKPLV